MSAAECGCPVNGAGDIRCHVCQERVNKRCWNCRTPRGEGPCPNPKRPRRAHTGDFIQVGIVGWTALCDETRSGNVILRSHITGNVKAVHIDTDYVMVLEARR